MINVWSYLEEYNLEKKDINNAINSVLESGKLILGPNVESFENEFSSWCGAKYSVGVGNGTDAIFLALKALDIQKGDQVITVSNTAVPTVAAITASGAEPVFVDIDPETYLMDIKEIPSKISKKTKAIIVVHLYGQTVDMTEINKIKSKYKLKIIEDCAQSTGAKFKNKFAGCFGDISTFSFYPTKILGTYGDGGLCMTNSYRLCNKLKRLRFYGMEKAYYSLEQGYNSRLDEMHAAILRKKLKNLDSYLKARKILAKRYFDELATTSYKLPKIANNNTHAFYIFVVRHNKRNKIIRMLKEYDINVNISYPWPIHSMKGLKKLTKKYSLPHTDKAAKEIFSLPMYPALSFKEQDKVIDALKKIEKRL